MLLYIFCIMRWYNNNTDDMHFATYSLLKYENIYFSILITLQWSHTACIKMQHLFLHFYDSSMVEYGLILQISDKGPFYSGVHHVFLVASCNIAQIVLCGSCVQCRLMSWKFACMLVTVSWWLCDWCIWWCMMMCIMMYDM